MVSMIAHLNVCGLQIRQVRSGESSDWQFNTLRATTIVTFPTPTLQQLRYNDLIRELRLCSKILNRGFRITSTEMSFIGSESTGRQTLTGKA